MASQAPDPFEGTGESWEELAKKIASSEIEDPVEAAEEAEKRKIIRSLERRKRVSLGIAASIIIVLTSLSIAMLLMTATYVLAEENVIPNGFGFWNSLMFGAVAVMTYPAIRGGLNFRNNA